MRYVLFVTKAFSDTLRRHGRSGIGRVIEYYLSISTLPHPFWRMSIEIIGACYRRRFIYPQTIAAPSARGAYPLKMSEKCVVHNLSEHFTISQCVNNPTETCFQDYLALESCKEICTK